MSAAFGDLRYSGPKISTTPYQNRLTHSMVVLSPILTYSSIESANMPYASMRSAAVIFCSPNKPTVLQHFFFARNNHCVVGAYVKFEETKADLNESTCKIMFPRRLDSQRSNHLAAGNGR